jgi:uncharacterized membrane protein
MMRGGAQGRALAGRLGSLWEGMVSGFWFLPGLLTASSVLLFGLTLKLEGMVPPSVSGLPLIFTGGADAARTLLSVISGSVVTVAATTFSLTLVALAIRAVGVGIPLLGTEIAPRVRSDMEDLADLTLGLPGGEGVREAVRSARRTSS